MTDIRNRDDIKKLVQTFYERLLGEEEFKTIFFEVAEVKILTHLDLLVDFWESVLFQAGKYKRDTLDVHLELHNKYRLNESHFRRWLKIFNETVDGQFAGPKANHAKESALSIATIIMAKIDQIEQLRKEIYN